MKRAMTIADAYALAFKEAGTRNREAALRRCAEDMGGTWCGHCRAVVDKRHRVIAR